MCLCLVNGKREQTNDIIRSSARGGKQETVSGPRHASRKDGMNDRMDDRMDDRTDDRTDDRMDDRTDDGLNVSEREVILMRKLRGCCPVAYCAAFDAVYQEQKSALQPYLDKMLCCVFSIEDDQTGEQRDWVITLCKKLLPTVRAWIAKFGSDEARIHDSWIRVEWDYEKNEKVLQFLIREMTDRDYVSVSGIGEELEDFFYEVGVKYFTLSMECAVSALMNSVVMSSPRRGRDVDSFCDVEHQDSVNLEAGSVTGCKTKRRGSCKLWAANDDNFNLPNPF